MNSRNCKFWFYTLCELYIFNSLININKMLNNHRSQYRYEYAVETITHGVFDMRRDYGPIENSSRSNFTRATYFYFRPVQNSSHTYSVVEISDPSVRKGQRSMWKLYKEHTGVSPTSSKDTLKTSLINKRPL